MARSDLHLAHGSMNFLAWGVLLPLGVIIARFAKPQPGSQGPPTWFLLHRIIQSLGLLFTLIAFAIALAMVDKDHKTHFGVAHSQIGLAVTIAGVMQPLNALFRPKPTPRTIGRKVWELVHRVLGYGAILLAVAAILTGLAKLTPKASTAVVGLYIAWAVLTAIVFIALEVWRLVKGRKLATSTKAVNSATSAGSQKSTTAINVGPAVSPVSV